MRIFGMPVKAWKNPPDWKASDVVLTDWAQWAPETIDVSKWVVLLPERREHWLARLWRRVVRK